MKIKLQMNTLRCFALANQICAADIALTVQQPFRVLASNFTKEPTEGEKQMK